MLAGLDVAVTSHMALTAEARYTWAKSALDPDFTNFERIDLSGLSDYLSLNYVPGPRTLVEGVEKVPPGTWLEVDRGGRRALHRFAWANEPDVPTFEGDGIGEKTRPRSVDRSMAASAV